jgi:hypothetical protein
VFLAEEVDELLTDFTRCRHGILNQQTAACGLALDAKLQAAIILPSLNELKRA